MGRRDPRQSASRGAKIITPSGSLPCRISNVSRRGALLSLPHGEWLPDTFELADNFSGERRQVKVAWKGPKSIGVRFLDGPDASLGPARTFGRRQN
jgi:hypothetical protein